MDETRRAIPLLPKAAVWLSLLALSVALAAAAGGASRGQAGPVGGAASAPRTLSLAVSGLTEPTHLASAGDGTGRLFILERAGRILIARGGTLQPVPFLDIRLQVGSSSSEQGLLSVAFPPQYAAKGYFYLNYTNTSGNTVISRFRLTADPDVADPASEQVVLTVQQPYPNHNGGQLAFGPRDGYLYIGMGDGGSAGDPENRAQNPTELLGKILRIDVETGSPATYTIPPSNPFLNTPGFLGEIWALGLRNPWRFSFDAGGNLYIGDVGQGAREEIDFQPAASGGGENYGWRILEGTQCFNPTSGCVPPDRYYPPVAEYDHTLGCSVTGGYADLGTYFYSDFCSGRIWGLRQVGSSWENTLLLQAPFGISTFGRGEDGALFVANYTGRAAYRLNAPSLTYMPYVPKGG